MPRQNIGRFHALAQYNTQKHSETKRIANEQNIYPLQEKIGKAGKAAATYHQQHPELFQVVGILLPHFRETSIRHQQLMGSRNDSGCGQSATTIERAVIGLGSNLGDRLGFLSQARSLVAEHVGEIVRASSVKETEAWGFDAPLFLNQILVIDTALEPFALLDTLQRIEKSLGRTEKSSVVEGRPVYHSRTIDLDILYYGKRVIRSDRLVVPHPRIAERAFILEQLAELGIPAVGENNPNETTK